MNKEYYVITTTMTFEKTVLVPVDSVKDADEAIDLVDKNVEMANINLFNEEAECKTALAQHVPGRGIYVLSNSEAEMYQVING